MLKRIDLHIHTNLSDGELSPKEVIEEAFKNNVSVIAIADHDTIEAYSDEFYAYAESKNIKVINAVEISTKTNKATVHILGYNFDVKNKELVQELSLLRSARHDYLHNVTKKLSELGYKLNLEKLDKIEAVTKAHIAEEIVTNKENEELLLKEFKRIPSRGDFIEAIMNEGCIAYVKKETVTPKEAVELIKKVGGKAILAHPVADEHGDNFTVEEIMNIVKKAGIEGLESNYIYLKNNVKINECDKWNKIAKENNLITTIGSDFHKKDGVHPEIGLVNEEINLSESEIEDTIRNLLS